MTNSSSESKNDSLRCCCWFCGLFVAKQTSPFTRLRYKQTVVVAVVGSGIDSSWHGKEWSFQSGKNSKPKARFFDSFEKSFYPLSLQRDARPCAQREMLLLVLTTTLGTWYCSCYILDACWMIECRCCCCYQDLFGGASDVYKYQSHLLTTHPCTNSWKVISSQSNESQPRARMYYLRMRESVRWFNCLIKEFSQGSQERLSIHTSKRL